MVDIRYVPVRRGGVLVGKFYSSLTNAKKAVSAIYAAASGAARTAATYQREKDLGAAVYQIDVNDMELAEPTPDEAFQYAERQMLRWTQRCMELRPGHEAELPVLSSIERGVLVWWLHRTPSHLREHLPVLEKIAGTDLPPIGIHTTDFEPSPSYVRRIVHDTLADVGISSNHANEYLSAPCGDNSCMFGPTGGMGTNGGCQCFGGRVRSHSAFDLASLVKRLASAILLLARQLAEYRFAAGK